METMGKRSLFHNNQKINIPLISKRNDLNANVSGFSYSFFSNHYKLSIYSDLFLKDNYTILLNDDKLIIVISEVKEYNRPIYIHNIQWNYSQTNTYERLRSMDIYLPGKNFYLIKHYIIPEKSMLYVVLSTHK